jgi:Sulfotransferase domain
MLDVIGVGFGRTGTYSLKYALEELGFGPCHHGYEMLRRPELVPLWERAIAGEPIWDEVFAGYRSTTDSPGADFWRELVEAYPDAKVVLTVRDPQRWYDSLLTLAEKLANPRVRAVIDARLRPLYGMRRLYDGVDVRDRAATIQRFEQHTEEVRVTVPADRLLVFDVEQGWQPLCAFLGVEVPDSEFPHRNDAEDMERLVADATGT